jgi:outer membrane receptor protein involved in Fe transport
MASLLRCAPWRTLAFVGLLTQVTSPGRGQVVPPPAPPKPAVTAKASTSGEVVELSPFEVRPEDDTGYQAGNTTSGSRLNARLKDTPASVSPFTAEFLSDIAATNLQEMLSYATNIEAELEDGQAGFNNPPGRDSTGGDYSFRVRGVIGGVSRDFVDATAPNDLYNVERAEVSSGPNSILFGLGPAGGLVSLTGKKANVRRTRGNLKTVFAEYDYQRYELDYNRVLLRDRLALRLLALHHTSEGWRKWTRDDQDRFTGAVTVKPFKHTSIDASYEKGTRANSLAVTGNAVDQLSLWFASNRPTADGAAVAGTNRLSTTSDRFTLFDNNGVIYNLKGELQSSSRYASATLAEVSLAPNQYNYIGPGGNRAQSFDNFNVNLEQRITRDLTVVASYFHNQGRINTDGANTTLPELRGDPNLTIPAPAGGTATVTNPYRGSLYMDTTWFKDQLVTTNDVERISAAYELDLGKWFGRHRLAAMAEHSKQERLRRWRNEILVDEKNVPITNAATPEGAQNQLNRRQYATETDFTTYFVGDPRTPIAPVTYNGRQLLSNYVSRTKANAHAFKEINSFMFAAQSFWLRDRLVTTVGYRTDDVEFRNENEARIAGATDPRVTSRQFILNEWDFNGDYTVNNYQPKTITAGVVLHATKQLSAFYNTSESNGPPRFDRTVLPNGGVPPPVTGSGRDLGLMFDFLGDNRYFARATYYKSDQLNDASIIPDGLTVSTSGSLGGDNLLNILGALRDAGKLTSAQYDTQAVTYNAAIIDIFTKGYEFDFVANPTRNLTLRLGYSYTDRRRGNFLKEIRAYFAEKVPEWRRLAGNDAALLATINKEIDTVDSEIAAQTTRQSAPFGNRPHKGTFTGRYSFVSGPLKGVFTGGSVRYQGRNFVSTNNATGRDYWGTATLQADAFAGLRTRLPKLNLPMTLQLNVTNVTNSYLVGIGRYNTAYDGLLRVYLNQPRAYRFTTTFEF